MDSQPEISKSTRLPRQQKGGVPIMLRRSVANLVMDACEALLNLRVLVPQTDGTTIQNPKEADIKRTGLGMTVTLPVALLPQPISSGGGTQQFKIVSDGGDYWNCNTWNGTTAGSSIIKVAKPQELRALTGKLTSEAVRGVTYSYTYTASTGSTSDGVNVFEYTRSVTGSDSSSETDYMTPPMLPGRVIVAISFTTSAPSTLASVSWMATTACAWAK